MKNSLLILLFVFIAGCSHSNSIKAGSYQINKDSLKSYPHSYLFTDKTELLINAKSRRVEVRNKKGQNIIFKLSRLEKSSWMSDCHTNMSHEILETWKLEAKSVETPLYIYASCFGEERITIANMLEHNRLSVLFDKK